MKRNTRRTYEYTPDYAVPPGETLQEVIDALGMSQAELAQRTGRPAKTINEIVKGKAAITAETALQLETVLGTPASFWINRERNYREALARLAERARLAEQVQWLERFPVRALVRLGWLQGAGDEVEQLRELLSFFGVAAPDQWEAVWQAPEVAYRKSKAFKSDPAAVSAWLRQGERVAQSISCQPYDESLFRTALDEIRALTRERPEVFQPKVVDSCARAGVAVVFVPELPGLRVSGAARWLTTDKALIQLSLRHKSDDHLWFAFYHEAAHLLLHGKREVFVDDGAGEDSKEAEANRFAANQLIPPKDFARLIETRPRSKAGIARAAEDLGISPGIVVGRLQHEGVLPFTHCNDLKRKLRWAA